MEHWCWTQVLQRPDPVVPSTFVRGMSVGMVAPSLDKSRFSSSVSTISLNWNCDGKTIDGDQNPRPGNRDLATSRLKPGAGTHLLWFTGSGGGVERLLDRQSARQRVELVLHCLAHQVV